jgi:hypothetical protein
MTGAAGIILIVIAATSFHDLVVGAQVCTVLYFCVGFIMNFIMVVNIYSPFVSLGFAAAYGGIEGRVRALTKLEISFLVLAIIGNLIEGIIRVSFRFFFQGMMYDEWIKTYYFASTDDGKTMFKTPWNTRTYNMYRHLEAWFHRIKGTSDDEQDVQEFPERTNGGQGSPIGVYA